MSAIIVQQENKSHFTFNSHYKIGVEIFLFAVFQALNGSYKPPAPTPTPTPPLPSNLDSTTHSAINVSTTTTNNKGTKTAVEHAKDNYDEPEIEVPG
jgi:cytochrome b561